MFIEAKDDGSVGDNRSYKPCKAPVTTNKPTSSFFTGRMPFLSPNQQCQSTEGKNITFHELAHPKLTWDLPTLSLTTNSSWLPCVRVAMPLISPLMPVPQNNSYNITQYSLLPFPFPLGLHALPLRSLDRACSQAEPMSSFARRVVQHTLTHAPSMGAEQHKLTDPTHVDA